MNFVDIGKKLKRLRIKHQLTLEELANTPSWYTVYSLVPVPLTFKTILSETAGSTCCSKIVVIVPSDFFSTIFTTTGAPNWGTLYWNVLSVTVWTSVLSEGSVPSTLPADAVSELSTAGSSLWVSSCSSFSCLSFFPEERIIEIERQKELDEQVTVMSMIDYSFFEKVANRW